MALAPLVFQVHLPKLLLVPVVTVAHRLGLVVLLQIDDLKLVPCEVEFVVVHVVFVLLHLNDLLLALELLVVLELVAVVVLVLELMVVIVIVCVAIV